MSIRSQCYFIIPFTSDTDGSKLAESLRSSTEWKHAQPAENSEIFPSITERYFGNDRICNVLERITAPVSFYDITEPERELSVSDIQLYIYQTGIHFAALCVEYSDTFSVRHVIQTNAALKYISTQRTERFRILNEPESSFSGTAFLTMLLKRMIPSAKPITNKALICSFTLCAAEEINTENNFHLATGNHFDFVYHPDIQFREFYQSAEVIQGISREGISRMVLDRGSDTYANPQNPYSLINSYRTQYLWIYILLLRQYFSFRAYNSDALNLYEQNIKKHVFLGARRKLIRLKTESELFYLQNVHSDVSQITYQNMLYHILYEIYHISALIDDFNKDMDICGNLLEKRTMNFKLLIIAVSSIIAALAEIFGLIADFSDTFG